MEPTTPYPEAVTAGILQAIEEANTTKNAVARGSGMTRNTFERRLAGRSFTITELANIAHTLGIPVEQLSAPRRAA
jgi:transcriptional regulator with XRE-family HTH domain